MATSIHLRDELEFWLFLSDLEREDPKLASLARKFCRSEGIPFADTKSDGLYNLTALNSYLESWVERDRESPTVEDLIGLPLDNAVICSLDELHKQIWQTRAEYVALLQCPPTLNICDFSLVSEQDGYFLAHHKEMKPAVILDGVLNEFGVDLGLSIGRVSASSSLRVPSISEPIDCTDGRARIEGQQGRIIFSAIMNSFRENAQELSRPLPDALISRVPVVEECAEFDFDFQDGCRFRPSQLRGLIRQPATASLSPIQKDFRPFKIKLDEKLLYQFPWVKELFGHVGFLTTSEMQQESDLAVLLEVTCRPFEAEPKPLRLEVRAGGPPQFTSLSPISSRQRIVLSNLRHPETTEIVVKPNYRDNDPA